MPLAYPLGPGANRGSDPAAATGRSMTSRRRDRPPAGTATGGDAGVRSATPPPRSDTPAAPAAVGTDQAVRAPGVGQSAPPRAGRAEPVAVGRGVGPRHVGGDRPSAWQRFSPVGDRRDHASDPGVHAAGQRAMTRGAYARPERWPRHANRGGRRPRPPATTRGRPEVRAVAHAGHLSTGSRAASTSCPPSPMRAMTRPARRLGRSPDLPVQRHPVSPCPRTSPPVPAHCATTCATSRSWPTSTMARPPSSTPCSGRRAPSRRTSSRASPTA